MLLFSIEIFTFYVKNLINNYIAIYIQSTH